MRRTEPRVRAGPRMRSVPPDALPIPLPDAAFASGFRAALSAWFAARGRQLAFRERSEPWGVLVSEVMAQQTHVAWRR